MVDLFPFVDKILSPLGLTVETGYGEFNYPPPYIILSEVENSSSFIDNGEEIFSSHTIQLDLFNDTMREVRELALGVSDGMIKSGFQRSGMLTAFEENGLYRITMDFKCLIDEQNKRIYTGT